MIDGRWRRMLREKLPGVKRIPRTLLHRPNQNVHSDLLFLVMLSTDRQRNNYDSDWTIKWPTDNMQWTDAQRIKHFEHPEINQTRKPLKTFQLWSSYRQIHSNANKDWPNENKLNTISFVLLIFLIRPKQKLFRQQWNKDAEHRLNDIRTS